MAPLSQPSAGNGFPPCDRRPEAVDQHVGRRIQARREELGRPLENLAWAVGNQHRRFSILRGR
jgi:hypothetical protein